MTAILAAIFVTEGTVMVRHADGKEEKFADLKERACSTLPEPLRGDMERSHRSQQGNSPVSFADSYYIGTDSTLSQEENEKRRGTAIGKRFAVMGAIVAELSKAGLEAGVHYSPKDSYFHRQSNTWRSTTQLWLNVNAETRSNSSGVVVSDDDLMTQAMVHDADAVDQLLENPKAYGDDGRLTSYGKAKLKAVIIRATNSKAPATSAPAEEDGDDDMPTD